MEGVVRCGSLKLWVVVVVAVVVNTEGGMCGSDDDVVAIEIGCSRG